MPPPATIDPVSALAELRAVLGGLDALDSAYTRAGILEPTNPSAATGPAGAEAADGHGAPGFDRDEAQRLRRTMLLVSGLLRNRVGAALCGSDTARRSQLAVFGGTQVGKSTAINILAGDARARVHHIAGFTRHPQAFLPDGMAEAELFAGNPLAFDGFTRAPLEALRAESTDEYSVSRMAPASDGAEIPSATPRPVLWDAPDCDAVGAARYQRALVEVLTHADAVVYVTSREKYAINAILEWVVLLQDAGIPVVAVLNMTPTGQQRDILASMRHALSEVRARTPSPFGDRASRQLSDAGATAAKSQDLPLAAAFEYVPDGDVTLLYGPDYEPGNRLRRAADALARRATADRPRRARRALAHARGAMAGLAAPALAELDAASRWRHEVGRSLEAFSDDYRLHYLDDPARYDAFARVGLEILTLLDPPIPGLARALGGIRMVLSIPSRVVAKGARGLWRSITGVRGAETGADGKSTAEVDAFRQAHQRLLNNLAKAIGERGQAHGRHRPFWDALDWCWERSLAAIEADFRDELIRHGERMDAHVRETARAIYTELAKEPIRLNILRTGRLTADAAAIILAVKTGGIGIHDLVMAPAFMSVIQAVSQLLTENYVDAQRTLLRARLLDDTRTFATTVYGVRLNELGDDALHDAGFGGLDAAFLRALPDRLAALEKVLPEPAPDTGSFPAGAESK